MHSYYEKFNSNSKENKREIVRLLEDTIAKFYQDQDMTKDVLFRLINCISECLFDNNFKP